MTPQELTPGTETPPQDKAIRAVARGLVMDTPPPATLYEAVARIRTWHDVMGRLSQVVAAQTMEALCIIRDQVPGDSEFRGVVERELAGILQPDRALLMARTWAAARKQRRLRELAASTPDEAMSFVSEFVASGREEDLDDETDPDVLAILTLPKRRRVAAVRDLIRGREHQDGRAAAHADPGSEDYLPGLQTAEEREAAEWRARLQVLAESVKEAERILGNGALAAEQLRSELLSKSARHQLVAHTDLIQGHIETIAELAMGDAEGSTE